MRDITPEEMEIMGRHFAYLQELSQRGLLLLAGPCLDDGGFSVRVRDLRTTGR